MLRIRKGQTVAEYAVLLSLVIAAALAIQVYVKRGIQARVKMGTDAYTSVTETITTGGEGAKSASFGTLSQYEPYYQETQYDRYQENIEQEHMGAGKVVKEKVSDVSAAKAGGYDVQTTGATTRTTRDAVWKDAAPAPQ